LLASLKGPDGHISIVDREKLNKAKLKQRLKQERRDHLNTRKLGESVSRPLQKQTASSGAIDVDETTLLEPHERSRKNRDIHLEKFDISIGGRHIVTEGQLTLPFGRRIGLIGRNGVGKSTLLRALSTRQLSVPKHVTILHVEQEVVGDDTSALGSVLRADSVREALLRREGSCNAKLNDVTLSSSEKDVAAAELQRIYARLEEIESEKAEARYILLFLWDCQVRASLGLP
jgi:ATP-binding cassette, subfamily F, member 3